MQIGNSLPSFAPAPPVAPARPLSADVSPDIARADQPPATPMQEAQADSSASGREEADRSPTDGRAGESAPSAQQQRLEQLEIAELSQRDREVRAHEQAHAAVGGQYAGAPSYSFKRGPDGQRYAVSGEVSIDTAPVPNDPEATLRKMEVIQRAALAPAEPSAQDRRLAAQAQAQAVQARVELAELRREEAVAAAEARQTREEARRGEEQAPARERQSRPAAPSLDLYRRLGESPTPDSRIDLLA
ncbi:putative metalloprotease CJM1_0395 family protein [Pseudomonas sp. SP16.1]|uniref:putative metalloprotease CJM1_0395 family protein n=1 Tax=Pseudomonas sp. SP16.1 TaxID=3458854 RepID=UPI0040464C79